MKRHLSGHPQIYVPIRLRCSHEITYACHMRLHTTKKVLGRHQTSLARVSNISRVNGPAGLTWTGLTSIRITPLVG